MKVSLSLDPVLLRNVDAYVAAHHHTDRSKVVEEALKLWSAAQQRSAMELQFAGDEATEAQAIDAWRDVRREATHRRMPRT